MPLVRNAALLALALAILPTVAAADGATLCTIPAGTHVTFLLNAPLSSAKNQTGEAFGFTLVHPIDAPGCTIPVDGAVGLGLVFLSGASGSNGHEGDLTIRPDSIRTPDGRVVTFDDQRIGINGRNRKIASTLLGFVPFAGIAAGYIRGSDIRIDDKTPIDTVLLHPATVTRSDSPTPLPSAIALPSPTAIARPSPTAIAAPTPARTAIASPTPLETAIASPSPTPTQKPGPGPAPE
jgi:hypothetical protein